MTQTHSPDAAVRVASSATLRSSFALPEMGTLWLAIAWLLYTVARLPPVFHAAGAMDEQFFSIPGYTVATEGIPRIPFLPAKKRETFFEGADVCLFALPPALHYCQAPFFWLMPLTNAPARMPAFLSGYVAILLLWLLARRVETPDWIAGLGCILFAVSRPLMFTSMIARPDLPCIVCGWSTIWILWRWQGALRSSQLVAAGAFCGLGLLFHPFAMVYCLQAGLWTLGRNGRIHERLMRASILTGTCLAVFSLWLPLILSYPEQFKSQFFSNVLERSGPGILGRILYPWPYFSYHWEKQWEFNEPIQFLLVAIGISFCSLLWLWRYRTGQRLGYLALLWSGAFLTVATAGIHPTKGYWAYSIGLAYPAIAESIVWLLQSGYRRFMNPNDEIGEIRWGWPARLMLSAGLLVLMVPGSGIRTTSAYWIHWGEKEYHAPTFIQGVLEELPSEGLFMADVNYVLDIYASGRQTILGMENNGVWGETSPKIDYLLMGQEGIDGRWDLQYNMRAVRREGNYGQPPLCFVDLFIPMNSKDSAGDR